MVSNGASTCMKKVPKVGGLIINKFLQLINLQCKFVLAVHVQVMFDIKLFMIWTIQEFMEQNPLQRDKVDHEVFI